jgi:hypothetical protein
MEMKDLRETKVLEDVLDQPILYLQIEELQVLKDLLDFKEILVGFIN